MGIRTSSLLLLAALTAAPAVAQTRGTTGTSQTIRGTNGQVLGTTQNPGSALGGSFIPVLGNRTAAQLLSFGVYKVSLGYTGTGWREEFVVGLPALSSGPSPVLVLFHGYGEKPEDLIQSTELFAKARARGWTVVAPLGAHQFNFGIDYSQTNTERVLDWVAQYLTIDVDRIYGAGFSMGGGWMNSFAARHQDPEGIRFAALVNHTGSASISDVWWNVVDTSLLESPLMFGGTPNAVPFRYSHVSSMDVVPGTNDIDPNTNMLRNLIDTPVRCFRVFGEPNQYLVQQTEIFDAELTAVGGTSTLLGATGNQHKWSTLDEDAALDWLYQHTYVAPAPARLNDVLADRDGRWDWFTLEQDAPQAFSRFVWTAVDSMNRLYLTGLGNVGSLRVDPGDLGLDGGLPLEVIVSSDDQLPTEVVLEGFSQMPMNVMRKGASTSAWTYDAANQRLILHEPNGLNFPLWEIVP